jgi:signal transduction histidine kinase
MIRFLTSAIVPVAIATASLALIYPHQSQAQSNLRERIATAVETVEGACGADVQNFCGKVTRGEGRLLTCMQAFEDQLSRRCQWALYRVSRNLEGAMDRVERLADACWNDIETHCRDADRIGQCIMSKRESLSPACGKVASAIRNAMQGLASLRGLQVVGSDNASFGEIVNIKKGADGAIQAIEIETDHMLGIGSKVVTITPDKFEQIGDKVRLLMGRDEVKSLPEAKSK